LAFAVRFGILHDVAMKVKANFGHIVRHIWGKSVFNGLCLKTLDTNRLNAYNAFLAPEASDRG